MGSSTHFAALSPLFNLWFSAANHKMVELPLNGSDIKVVLGEMLHQEGPIRVRARSETLLDVL